MLMAAFQRTMFHYSIDIISYGLFECKHLYAVQPCFSYIQHKTNKSNDPMTNPTETEPPIETAAEPTPITATETATKPTPGPSIESVQGSTPTPPIELAPGQHPYQQ